MIDKIAIISLALLAFLLSLVSYYLDYPWFMISYTSCMAAVLTVFIFITPKD